MNQLFVVHSRSDGKTTKRISKEELASDIGTTTSCSPTVHEPANEVISLQNITQQNFVHNSSFPIDAIHNKQNNILEEGDITRRYSDTISQINNKYSPNQDTTSPNHVLMSQETTFLGKSNTTWLESKLNRCGSAPVLPPQSGLSRPVYRSSKKKESKKNKLKLKPINDNPTPNKNERNINVAVHEEIPILPNYSNNARLLMQSVEKIKLEYESKINFLKIRLSENEKNNSDLLREKFKTDKQISLFQADNGFLRSQIQTLNQQIIEEKKTVLQQRNSLAKLSQRYASVNDVLHSLGNAGLGESESETHIYGVKSALRALTKENNHSTAKLKVVSLMQEEDRRRLVTADNRINQLEMEIKSARLLNLAVQAKKSDSILEKSINERSGWIDPKLYHILHNIDSESKIDASITLSIQMTKMMHSCLSVNCSVDMTVMATRTLELLCDLLLCDRATLFNIDYSHKKLISYVSTGWNSTFEIPLDKGIAGYVATTGESCRINDAYDEPRFFSGIDASTNYKTRDLICIPIEDSLGMRIAVVEAMNTNHRHGFSETDEIMLRLLGMQLGIILCQSKNKQNMSSSQRKLLEILQLPYKLVKLCKGEGSSLQLSLLVANTIETNLQEITKSPRVKVFFWDKQSNHLWCRVQEINHNCDTTYVKRFSKLTSGICGYVATSGVSLSLNDPSSEAKYNSSIDLDVRTNGLFTIPIKAPDSTVLGVLQVAKPARLYDHHIESTITSDRDDATSIELIEMFGKQLSLILPHFFPNLSSIMESSVNSKVPVSGTLDPTLNVQSRTIPNSQTNLGNDSSEVLLQEKSIVLSREFNGKNEAIVSPKDTKKNCFVDPNSIARRDPSTTPNAIINKDSLGVIRVLEEGDSKESSTNVSPVLSSSICRDGLTGDLREKHRTDLQDKTSSSCNESPTEGFQENLEEGYHNIIEVSATIGSSKDTSKGSFKENFREDCTEIFSKTATMIMSADLIQHPREGSRQYSKKNITICSTASLIGGSRVQTENNIEEFRGDSEHSPDTSTESSKEHFTDVSPKQSNEESIILNAEDSVHKKNKEVPGNRLTLSTVENMTCDLREQSEGDTTENIVKNILEVPISGNESSRDSSWNNLGSSSWVPIEKSTNHFPDHSYDVDKKRCLEEDSKDCLLRSSSENFLESKIDGISTISTEESIRTHRDDIMEKTTEELTDYSQRESKNYGAKFKDNAVDVSTLGERSSNNYQEETRDTSVFSKDGVEKSSEVESLASSAGVSGGIFHKEFSKGLREDSREGFVDDSRAISLKNLTQSSEDDSQNDYLRGSGHKYESTEEHPMRFKGPKSADILVEPPVINNSVERKGYNIDNMNNQTLKHNDENSEYLPLGQNFREEDRLNWKSSSDLIDSSPLTQNFTIVKSDNQFTGTYVDTTLNLEQSNTNPSIEAVESSQKALGVTIYPPKSVLKESPIGLNSNMVQNTTFKERKNAATLSIQCHQLSRGSRSPPRRLNDQTDREYKIYAAATKIQAWMRMINAMYWKKKALEKYAEDSKRNMRNTDRFRGRGRGRGRGGHSASRGR